MLFEHKNISSSGWVCRRAGVYDLELCHRVCRRTGVYDLELCHRRAGVYDLVLSRRGYYLVEP